MSYTADDLLTEVRRAASLPNSSPTGTADADLLAHADNEVRDTLVPLLLSVQESFYLRVFDVAVTSGVASYRLDKRLAQSRVDTVQFLPSASGLVYNLVRIDPKRPASWGALTTTTGFPSYFYLEGSRIVLHPTPNSSSGTLRVRGFVRPSRLTLTTDIINVLTVSAVSVGATLTTLTTAAHGIASTAARDVVASTPSFEHLALDATATQTSSTTVTIPNTSFTTAPIVGDYMCVSDYSPFIQLPVELHPVLFERTAARVLRSLGKLSEVQAREAEAGRLEKLALLALTPRTEEHPRKLVGGPAWRRKGLFGGGFR